MTAKTLEQLYTEHKGKVSYKWSAYLSEYQRVFEQHRLEPIRLMEIGIQNGGSLEIWSKYFVNATILMGCDINPNCGLLKYEDPRITVVIGDANTDEIQEKIHASVENFDIIIDDGSHSSSDIIKSFGCYFERLTDGGLYLAEDLHASYWQEYEGGLYDPYSSISFFKRLADVVNYDHWGIEKSRVEFMQSFFIRFGFNLKEETLKHIHSIEFINSICVVRKGKPDSNTLGHRFITGTLETITEGHLEMNLSSAPAPPDQRNNRWSALNMPPEEELPLRIRELAERDTQIAHLKQDLIGLAVAHEKIEEILTSSSWRITAPLRFIADTARKLSQGLSKQEK
jgi:cephalosporin hydroxylase